MNKPETAKTEPKPDGPQVREATFLKYLLGERKLIVTGIVITAFLFALIKYIYPYPDFFLDSYSYIGDAVFKRQVTYRPVGYAFFLNVIHDLSKASAVTVFAQYLLFVISAVFFFFSCDYLFGLPVKIKKAAFFLTIINPILLLQSNLISSDSLFCSASVTWFALCLWCLMKPNWYTLILQALLIFCCFHLRYTALFYPAIAVVFFVISKGKMLYKLTGILLTVGVIYFTIEHRKDVMEEGTGLRILTAFSGWQIANNVLCYYKDIQVDPADLPSDESRIIDKFVRSYIDTLYLKNKNSVGTHYLWTRTSPLKLYQFARMKFFNTPYADEWTACSVNLSEYGWSIIKKDPFAYVRFYMGRNFKHFLFPDAEILGNYDRLHSRLPPETKEWFGLDIDYLECRYPGLQEKITYPYPVVSFLINFWNIVLIFVFLFVGIRHRKLMGADNWRLLLSWSVFYFGFVFFCLFSTVVLLRYLDPLFILGIVMPVVLWSRIQSVKEGEA